MTRKSQTTRTNARSLIGLGKVGDLVTGQLSILTPSLAVELGIERDLRDVPQLGVHPAENGEVAHRDASVTLLRGQDEVMQVSEEASDGRVGEEA